MHYHQLDDVNPIHTIQLPVKGKTSVLGSLHLEMFTGLLGHSPQFSNSDGEARPIDTDGLAQGAK